MTTDIGQTTSCAALLSVMSDRQNAAPRLSRRTLWKLTGTAAVAAAVPAGISAFADETEPAGSVRLRWLGTNAWEFRTDTATVLIDPWVSRFRTGAYQGDIDPDLPIEVYPDVIDAHLDTADTILVTHGHYDHISDVPYIAGKTGATVLGTETHLNLLRAMDTPTEQLGQVAGGEYYQFDGYTIEVFRSSHGVSDEHRTLLFSGTLPEVPPRPSRIKDLREGGSLAYLVTCGDLSLYFNATPAFHEREIAGLRPDILFMQGANPYYPRYVERLFKATGYPPYVLPTHWDDFEKPLTEPAVDEYGAADLEKQVAEVSPASQFIKLDHLDSHTFTA